MSTLCALAVAVVCFRAVEGSAVARPPTRTVVVFDNSGSMRANDPQRLAEAAAMLYVQLAKANDQLCLVSFAERGRVVLPCKARRRQRRVFEQRLRRLKRRGRISHIGHGLETALGALGPKQDGVTDVVVLLTDGKVDLGRSRQHLVSPEIRRIRTVLADTFASRGVPLYTIAFTEASDRALMDAVARRTRGSFRYIPSAKDLHTAFSDLFAVASGASALPVQDGGVVVDGSIKKTSLVLTKDSPGDANVVVAPDEQVLTQRRTRKGVKWKASSSYDLVELNQPQTGPWQMLGPDGKPAKAVAFVQDSSLELIVTSSPKDPTLDDALGFTVELVENGRRVIDYARLKNMSVEAIVEAPSRRRRTVLFDQTKQPGRFAGEIRSDEPGHHAVWVTAMSPLVQRQWKGSFVLRSRCFEPDLRVDGQDAQAEVRMAPDCPKYKSVTIESARHVKGKVPRWRPVASVGPGVYRSVIRGLKPGEKGEARLRITAETADGHTLAVEPPPLSLPAPPPDEWLQVIGMRLAYINIPLILIAGIVLGIRQLRKEPDAEDL